MVQRHGDEQSQLSEREPLLSETAQPGSGYHACHSISKQDSGNGVLEPVPEVDEEWSLGRGETESLKEGPHMNVVKIISVMLLGIFVAQTDGSILLATHTIIASEFNALKYSSWLIISFSLAGAATQTLYGKLSDIYGRKRMVIIAYTMFMVGCAIVGVGQSMWQVVLGRIVSGAGASGMSALVSVLITDLLPLREVAQWRAYVNLVATLGRSTGGPLGGWLADVVGWRWSFLGQVPPVTLAIILCSAYLPNHTSTLDDETDASAAQLKKSKFSRIDFKGAFIFATLVLALLLPIELGGVNIPWSHPLIFVLLGASAVLLVLFIAVEKRQEEPILPLEIFHSKDAILSFLILGLQTAAQLGIMFTVPLYFQVTSTPRPSATVAGAHLVPAVVGNAVGGIISGSAIKRSGRYKSLVVWAVTCSSIGYLLLMLRWHGNTNWLESLYIFPGGFGMGVASSALFISLQVVIDPAHMAPAISFMYLMQTVWMTIGLPAAGAIMQTVLRRSLVTRLFKLGYDGTEVAEIISKAVSDVDFIDGAIEKVKNAVVQSYIDGLWWSHGFSFVCTVTALVLAVFLKQRRLDGNKSKP
ncbi:major facilitator superfamily domain-containing protein [Pseudoneurospora amorphoporcata]|uniref:Major facilitator superfamily domain-containing protein n=1 Tax=Pseudoneurospora amorphoporcata TaxID=241081 RepID=A0AAN6NPV3_9PEZI|nr:major facilitator superfamily domain-containing protein [Pseudoneurospora amorphoporcata]